MLNPQSPKLSPNHLVPTPYPSFFFPVSEYSEISPKTWLSPSWTTWYLTYILSDSDLLCVSSVLDCPLLSNSPDLVVAINFKAILSGNIACPVEEEQGGGGICSLKKRIKYQQILCYYVLPQQKKIENKTKQYLRLYGKIIALWWDPERKYS